MQNQPLVPTMTPNARTPLYAVGARTPSGLSALQATTAARAGKLRPRPSHLVDKRGEPMGLCRFASLADNLQGLERFVALGAPALVEATASWRAAHLRPGRQAPLLPLLVALPSASRPGIDPRLGRELLPRLQAHVGLSFDPRHSRTISHDRGGGVEAFAEALRLLDQGFEAVVVGGIDTYFDPDVLEWLDAEYRLHSLETENGIVPGEGAAFVLLGRRGRVPGLRPLASLLGAAAENEPRPYGSPEPCHALGMSRAIQLAIGPLARERRISWVLTDVPNERHRVDEWQLAFGRMFRAFTPEVRHDQPLLMTGEVGAASAALLVAMACVQWQIGCGVGDMALVATHSDGPERGALVLAREGGMG